MQMEDNTQITDSAHSRGLCVACAWLLLSSPLCTSHNPSGDDLHLAELLALYLTGIIKRRIPRSSSRIRRLPQDHLRQLLSSEASDHPYNMPDAKFFSQTSVFELSFTLTQSQHGGRRKSYAMSSGRPMISATKGFSGRRRR